MTYEFVRIDRVDCGGGRAGLDDLHQVERKTGMAREWLKVRIADECFALDCMERAKMRKSLDSAWNTENAETVLKILAMTDTDKIGLMGHSLGGASSVTLARQRSDIDAVVDLDGTMLVEIVGVQNGKNVYNEEMVTIQSP